MMRTSIIPGLMLLLLSCLSRARNIYFNDDSDALQPIMSQSRQTRICAELCMSGLGGTPCGDICFDLIPTNIPLVNQQKKNSSERSDSVLNGTARQDSCDVLCKNKLGYPLCQCSYDQESTIYIPDFIEVCATFCVKYDYQLMGCQNCTIYKSHLSVESQLKSSFNLASLDLSMTNGGVTILWVDWCKDQCQSGNGGAACNCDLLP